MQNHSCTPRRWPSFAWCLALLLSLCTARPADAVETLTYRSSGSDSLAYNVDTAGAQLIPFVGYEVENSARAVSYESLTFPRFDPSLGTLLSVRIEFTATATTEHERSGLCETLVLIILCTFGIESDSSASYGIGIPGYNDNRQDPPIIGGVPSVPAADFFATQSFGSDSSFFGAAIDTNPPDTSGPVTINFTLPASSLEYYSAGGTFKLSTEILSQGTVKLGCEVAVLAACQGTTRFKHGFSYTAKVIYRYEPGPARVDFYVNDKISWSRDARVSSGGAITEFPTTSAILALAEEVSSPPGRNRGLGSTLTFTADPSGRCRAFKVRTLQSGAAFTFDDDEGNGNLANFDNALSVGDIDNREDDDFEISFPTDGPPAYAVSFVIRDSNGNNAESLQVYDRDNLLIGRLANDAFPANGTYTLSLIANRPIGRVVFDEDSGGDDIAVADFAFDDPRYSDWDRDGLDDCTEAYVLKTSPLDGDTDDDGLSDRVDPNPLLAMDDERQVPLPWWGLSALGGLLVLVGLRRGRRRA
ncbi:MAG: choice-of-anchor E domain-containing protein [Gammaproteobacteria bacterium]|nr:choice-of-anchor E domain-containing protein [Gammaproteobacteria bacterium]